MKLRYPQIVVIGDSEVDEHRYAEAVEIGQLIGKLGAVVITGGRGGVMEAVSKGARMVGAMVAGIVPSDKIEDGNPYCQLVLPTGMGHARNALTVMAGDLVVAIGGGAGTLSEISFAWIYKKPIIVWKDTGWSGKLAGKSIDSKREDKIIACDQLTDLKMFIMELCREKNLMFKE